MSATTQTTVAFTGEVHPLANRFPMLPEDELALLGQDITENGLQQPVVIDQHGRLVAGRNRLAACEMVDVEPEFETSHFDSDAAVAAFVISENVHRRHQSTGSRAMSTALVLTDAGRRENGRWKRGSVSQDSDLPRDVWRVAMAQAGTVLDHAPDLADQVVAGDLALDAAHRQATDRRDAEADRIRREEEEAKAEAEAREFVEQEAPDLAGQVGGPFQTYIEALKIWEQRNREEADRIARKKAKQKADERAARENAITEFRNAASSIQVLTGAQYPEWRERNRRHAMTVGVEVPPATRSAWEPTTIRDVAGWLVTLAEEMENQS